MNAKILVFVIGVEAIIYLYNLHDSTFKLNEKKVPLKMVGEGDYKKSCAESGVGHGILPPRKMGRGVNFIMPLGDLKLSPTSAGGLAEWGGVKFSNF